MNPLVFLLHRKTQNPEDPKDPEKPMEPEDLVWDP